MKISQKRKADRKRFFRRGEKCPECGGDIEAGGHYVPAVGLWICTGRQPGPVTLETMLGPARVLRDEFELDKEESKIPIT